MVSLRIKDWYIIPYIIRNGENEARSALYFLYTVLLHNVMWAYNVVRNKWSGVAINLEGE